MTTTLTAIPIDSIQRGDNDRQSFDQVALEELSESIRTHGLVQPITIRPMGNGHYQIVAGERRWRACKMLAWTEIPAIVRDLDDEAASAIMLAENIGRADLNPMEQAHAYSRRVEKFGWTVKRLAETAGVSEQTVKKRMALVDLVDTVQAFVANGEFPLGHADLMTKLDHNRQRIAIRAYNASGGMRRNQFRQLISEMLEQQNQEALFDIADFWIAQVPMEDQRYKIWGQGAVIDVLKSTRLPWPVVRKEDSAGQGMDRYIRDLTDGGFESEARALGNLYQAMVTQRKMHYKRAPTHT